MQPLVSEPQAESLAALHRDLLASGVRLRVVEDGSGPSVVLLHGLFVDHRTWDGVRAALRKEFCLILPDLPGFGLSEKPAPNRFAYGIDAFAEAIADLYAALELGRAALVGHGLGGAVALTLAARHPELVSHLVLIDPVIYADPPGLETRCARLPLIGNLVFKQVLGKTLFRAFLRDRLVSAGAELNSQRIDDFYESFNSPAARGSALATLKSSADTRAVAAQTSRIQTPTLIVWGRHDTVAPVRHGQRLAREIRDARFELIETGHAPQEERAADLAALLSRFLHTAR